MYTVCAPAAFVVYHAIIVLSCTTVTSHAVLFISSKLETNVTFSISCLLIFVFPKNPDVSDVSDAVDLKQLYTENVVNLFTFSDVSFIVPAIICISTLSASELNPFNVTVFWNPYCTVFVTPFSTLVSVKGISVSSIVIVTFSANFPSVYTFILSGVKLFES